MDNFDFKGMRLDNAFRQAGIPKYERISLTQRLRHLCNKLYFKGEAQQLDRILVTFSAKFWEYNSLPVYHGPGECRMVMYEFWTHDIQKMLYMPSHTLYCF